MRLEDSEVSISMASFPCTIVHDVKGSEFAVPHDAITHKINAPTMIDGYGLLKGLSDSGLQTSLSSAFLIHFEELVNSINTLVVPYLTTASQVSIKLSKTVGWVFPEQILQRFDDVAVILGALVGILRSWYGGQFEGRAHRYAVIAYQFFGYLPFGGRAQHFFENRSLKSWLSFARSGYILLRREYSSSTVFSFYTLDTSNPQYLAYLL
jgi:hypothetical protein